MHEHRLVNIDFPIPPNRRKVVRVCGYRPHRQILYHRTTTDSNCQYTPCVLFQAGSAGNAEAKLGPVALVHLVVGAEGRTNVIRRIEIVPAFAHNDRYT